MCAVKDARIEMTHSQIKGTKQPLFMLSCAELDPF